MLDATFSRKSSLWIRHALLLLFLAVGGSVSVSADTVQWLNATSGNWDVATNWYDTTLATFKVPAATDDVFINVVGTYTVTIDSSVNATPAAANSITLGSASTGNVVTLAVAKSLTVGSGSSSVNPQGAVSVSAGTLTLGGTMNATGPINLSGGTLMVNGTTTASQFTMTNGILDGTGTLAVTSSATWDGGTLQGLGSLDIGASALLDLTANASRTLNARTINNSGIINFSGGQINSGNGAIVNNLAGGQFNFTADVSFLYNTGGSLPTFNDGGSVTKNGGTATSQIGAFFNFQSGASLTATSGTLSLTSGGTFASNSVASGGTIDLNGGTFTMNNGSALQGPTTLSAGTLFVSAGVTTPVDSFDMNNGILDGPGILSVQSAMNWNAGTIQGSGSVDVTFPSGVLTIGTISTKSLNARTINNSGAVHFTGGQVNSGNAAIINNVAGATFDFQGDLNFFYNTGGATPTFNNAGTLTKSVGPGTATLSTIVNNQAGGAITVASGTLSLTSGGTFDSGTTASGGILQLNGGTFTLNNGASLTGPTHLTAGTIFVAGASVPVSAFDFDNGIIDGPGILLVAGTMNWNAGTAQGAGSIDVQPSTGILNLATAGTKTHNGRTINNSGSTIWTAGQINSGNSAVFNNLAAGTFDIQTDNGYFYNIGGAASAFNNAGIVKKSAGPGTAELSIAYNQSGGSTTAASGTLYLSGGGTGTGGTYDATAGNILQFAGTHTLGAAVTVTAAGTISVITGTTTVAGTYTVANLTSVSGGRLDFNTNATSNTVDLINGAIGGTGTITAPTFNWQSGTLDGAGTLDVSTLLSLTTAGTKTHNQRTINNATSAVWSGGQINSGSGAIFNNLAGATFDIQTDNGYYYNLGGATSTFNNAGIVTKSAGPGTGLFTITYNQTGGSTTGASGTLYLSGGGTGTGGTYDATAGNILQFGGTHTLGAAVTVTAAGTISVITGTTTVAGTYNVANLTSVNGGRLDLNTNATSNTVDLISGAIGGTGTLTAPTFNWQSGTLDGAGTLDVSTLLSLSTAGTKTHNQRTINNSTSAVWSGGQINSGSGAIFNNLATATFDIQTDNGYYYNLGGATSTFNNAGIVTKSAGPGVGLFTVTYNQTGGSTSAASGTIYLSGGGTGTGGTYGATAGNVLQFGGTHTLGAAVTVSGAGTIAVITGTTTVAGTYNVAGVTSVNGGRLDLNTNATSNTIDLLNGAIGGSGVITAPTFNWQSGTVDGAGTLDVSTLLSLTTAGTKSHNQRTINNAASAVWSGGQINSGSGAIFNNLAGATFDIQTDNGYYYNLGGATPTFNNAGTVQKSAGPGVGQFTITYNQTSGSTTGASGTLYLSSGGTGTGGTYDATAGNILQFGGTHTLGAAVTVSAAGTISVITGTTTVAGTYNVANLTSVNGGRLDVNTNATSNTIDLLSGAIGGSGAITAPTFNWQGGTVDGSGTLAVSTLLSLTTTGTKSHSQRTINNSASAVWNGGQINSGNGAIFNNLAGATFDMQTDDGYYNNLGGAAPTFNNAGTMKKSAGTLTSTIGFQLNNTGIVQALSGILAITSFTQTAGTTTLGGGSLSFSNPAAFNGGILNGTGTITGNVTNAAQVNPGTSPGMISITGNYTQTIAGTLNIELAGTTAGTQFDQLNVSGTATLAGTLNVSLISPYSPLNGDAYAVVNAGTLAGTFGTTNGLNLGGGRQLTPNYSATALTLVASGAQTNNAAIDFSAITNPNGVWSYGWTPSIGGAFTLLNTIGNVGGADVWSRNGAEPTVFHNPTTSPISFATWTLPAGKLAMHPGSAGEYSVVRWTAPAAGTFRLNGFFNGIDSTPTTTDVAIQKNGITIFTGNVNSFGSPLNFSMPFSLNAGDQFDFMVGFGSDGNFNSDATQLEAAFVAVGTADLSLTKTDSADPVIVGSTFNYTITAANAGPSSATSVVVTDTLPAGLTFVSATPSQGTCSGTTTITCSLGTIASAASATITITVQAATVTTVTNTASATLNEFDPNTANNTASQSTTINPVPQADLSLTIVDAPDPVNAGATLTYTITANNAGPNAASSVVVTDVLPAGMTFVSASGSGWSCVNSAGTVTCSMPTLAVGPATPITIQVTAPVAAGTVSNTATISSSTADPAGANNSATASTTVNGTADLQISKSGPASANAGSTISWTISASNAGPSSASSVTVTDTLPAGTTFVSATGTGWSCTNSAGTVTCTMPLLVVGSASPITLQATAPGTAGSITNTATISSSATDPAPTNNTASATTNVAAVADLSIAKSASPNPVPTGSALNYTIDVTNLGPSGVSSVTVTDTLPAGTTFVSASGSTWTCAFSAGVVTCTHGALPVGAAPSITIVVNAPSANGTITNSASVSSPTPDPNPGNNTASTSTTVGIQIAYSDVSVSINGPATANVNQPVAYAIDVANAGPAFAPNVVLNVNFSPSLRFDSTSGSGWSCSQIDLQRFRCTLAGLVAHSTRSLVFNMTPTSPGTARFAGSVSSGSSDPDTSNNSAAVSTEVALGQQPNLVMTKTASVASAPAGSTFSYAFSVANTGNLTATSVNVVDPIPSDLGVLSIHNGDWNCSYAAGSPLSCTLPSLAPGASSSFSIDVQAPPQPGEVSNTASVSSVEPDADASNNSSTAVTAIGCPLVTDVPVLSAPRTINSGQHYTITLNKITHATKYEIQESLDEDFTNPVTIETDQLSYGFEHEVQQVTRYFYRARVAKTDCGDSGPFSDPIPVTIEPFNSSNPNPSIAVEFGDTDPVTQTIFIAQPATGETHFEARTDRPWMTVSPTSGAITAAGVYLTVTADPSQLDVGTNTGTVLVTFSNAAKRSPAGTPPSTSVPVSVSLVTPVIVQPPTSPSPDTLIIPAVAHVDTPNARWQSDVRLTNAGNAKLRYQLSFMISGPSAPSSVPQTTLDVKPGQSVALNDIVHSWFGLGALSDGTAGVLQIRPMDPAGKMSPQDASVATVASSRTFSIGSNGTSGQFVPAIRFASFVGGAGAKPVLNLQQIAQSASFRTNLGLVEASGQPANVLVNVFNPLGSKLASIPLSLKANEHMQINSFLEKNNISLADGRIEVQVTSDTGKITTYASVVDNGTNDPLFESGTPLNANVSSDYLLGGVGDVSNDVNHWRTDVRLFNPTSGAVTATMTYYPERNPAAAKSMQISLAPGEVRAFDNILEAAFNVKNSVGLVRVTPSLSSSLVATARTYDKQDQGTFGQFVPAVTAQQSVGAGDRPLQILQVEESDRFRTNLGIFEVTGKPVKVEVGIIAPEVFAAATYNVTLQGYEFQNLASLMKAFGLPATYNGRFTVRVIEGQGRVSAYGSVIDLKTQDPTYVPAQ